jgi:hypothetical protein
MHNPLPFWTGCVVVAAALAVPWLEDTPPAPPGAPLVDLHEIAPQRVKSQAFRLPSASTIQIEAAGLEGEADHGTMTLLETMFDGKRPGHPWAANAWILDLTTRSVVWELSAAKTSRGVGETLTFNGTAPLPAGAYEAFYSFYPAVHFSDDDKDQQEKRSLLDRLWNGSTTTVAALGLTIRSSGTLLDGHDLARINDAFAASSIVNFRATARQQFQETGFSLTRPTQVDVYAVGEARKDGSFDSGWIVNTDTKQKVWALTWDDSGPAGGAEKNRVAHFTKTLASGHYAAFYGTDDSHDPSAWNASPPHDPDRWGLLVRVPDPSARAEVKTFAYEHVPAASTIVALTGLGDSEDVARGFTLARPMDVRVYALGEGRDGRMVDYGWIVGPNHRRVWEMRYDGTESAGGDVKNRLVDRVVHLDAGDYTVYFVTDDSHSAKRWNASAPPDGQRWGITLLAANGTSDARAVSTHAEVADPSIVAQIVRVRDHERKQTTFTLAQDSRVRIYALGEADDDELADYGWIEEAKSHRKVWEMTYPATQPAGGAVKNRRFEGTISLAAGDYIAHYVTDGSHAFGEWNASPPDDPMSWGITISRDR